jgi:hypothetical protein
MKIFLLDFAGLPATKVVLGMITPVMLFIFSLGKATGTDEAESLTPPPGSYRLLSDNAQIRFP